MLKKSTRNGLQERMTRKEREQQKKKKRKKETEGNAVEELGKERLQEKAKAQCQGLLKKEMPKAV